MGFIFAAIIVGIIVFVVQFRMKIQCIKYFWKYDKDRSPIFANSLEEFLSQLNAVTQFDIGEIECLENEVTFTYQFDKYIVKCEEGKAYIDYAASNCEVNPLKFCRLFRGHLFKLTMQRAISVNSIMDHIARQNPLVGAGEYSRIKAERIVTKILILIAVVLLGVGVYFLVGDKHDEAIQHVKTSMYKDGRTYEEVIRSYIHDAEWTAFISGEKNDLAVVEVNGISVNNEKICIQFLGESGLGFDHADTQTFTVSYFEVDGTSCAPDSSMELIYNYTYGYTFDYDNYEDYDYEDYDYENYDYENYDYEDYNFEY